MRLKNEILRYFGFLFFFFFTKRFCMTFKIYNTLTRALTDFKPIHEGKAVMYVCGPTVYDHAHIGHARASVAFEILVRHLIAKGFDVTFARNYTDIDDKIIKKAKECDYDWKKLTEEFILSFSEDMKDLNCLDPTYTPKATEYVKEIVEDVASIVERGFAYLVDGDVYFDVLAYKDYGKFSKRKMKDMEAGARVEVNDLKKHPADFVLWKSSKPGEPAWESPWGPGRPGWHIECSTMSARLLGDSFDIHGGGQDLIFPHHENEIAQSGALGRKMANIWAHNGFVNINNEKMSKSLGNSFTIKEIFKIFPPEVLRFFLLSSHYRGPIDYSEEALKESAKALERIYRSIEASFSYLAEDIKTLDFGENLSNISKLETDPEAKTFTENITLAMDDDLHTSKALGILFDVVRLINKLITEGNKSLVKSYLIVLFSMGKELGLKFSEPKIFFQSLDKLAQLKGEKKVSSDIIEEKISLRNIARRNKDWSEADRLRKELADMGVVLEDKGEKTTWRFVI
jgi:cysteinyl-tRNA synthetase